MPDSEPKSFDPHEAVRLDDPQQMQALSEALDATPEEISQAVEKVGDHPRAVAIFLGKGAEV